MTGAFWDDLAWDVNDPAVLAAYNEASAMIEALDGIANATDPLCHCGVAIYFNDAITAGFTRGLCHRCDDLRCDAYPGACA